MEPPETTAKHESAIFRDGSISAYSQSTIARSEAGILARSAGHRTQFSLRLARAAAQRGSTSRCSPWSKPVNHLKNAPEQIAMVHGATVRVSETKGGGATVSLRF